MAIAGDDQKPLLQVLESEMRAHHCDLVFLTQKKWETQEKCASLFQHLENVFGLEVLFRPSNPALIKC